MPARHEFEIQELKPWLGHLALITLGETATFRLCGTNLIARFGADMTGRCPDDVSDELRPDIQSAIEHVRANRAPLASKAHIHVQGQKVTCSELILPLSDDGEQVSMLLYASYPESKKAALP